MTGVQAIDFQVLKGELTAAARALGFDALGVAPLDIPADEQHLLRWLAEGFHGEMHYMQRHGVLRSRPRRLVSWYSISMSVGSPRCGGPDRQGPTAGLK